MEKDKFTRRLWIWYHSKGGKVIAAIAALYFVYSFIGSITGWTVFTYFSNSWAYGLSVVVFILYWVFDAWKSKNELRDLIETQPNVIAQQVDYELVYTTIRYYFWNQPDHQTSGTSNLSTDYITEVQDTPVKSVGPTYERYYLSFKNIKLEGKGIRDAEDVHAIITFTNNQRLSHEKPRWIGQLAPRDEQRNITIKANGKSEDLCLVIREQGNKDFYVFSGDSYTNNSFDPLKGGLRLSEDVNTIQIRLQDKFSWHEDYSIKMTIGNDEPIFEVMSMRKLGIK